LAIHLKSMRYIPGEFCDLFHAGIAMISTGKFCLIVRFSRGKTTRSKRKLSSTEDDNLCQKKHSSTEEDCLFQPTHGAGQVFNVPQ
jgi:hypothetical protein